MAGNSSAEAGARAEPNPAGPATPAGRRQLLVLALRRGNCDASTVAARVTGREIAEHRGLNPVTGLALTAGRRDTWLEIVPRRGRPRQRTRLRTGLEGLRLRSSRAWNLRGVPLAGEGCQCCLRLRLHLRRRPLCACRVHTLVHREHQEPGAAAGSGNKSARARKAREKTGSVSGFLTCASWATPLIMRQAFFES